MNSCLKSCLPLLLLAVASVAAVGAQGDSPPVRVLLPATRDVNAKGGLPLRRLLDIPMRDPNITRGPDGNYYLVGTTDPPADYTALRRNEPGQMWTINDGIRMWKSPDLIHWQPLGLIWSIDRDGAGTWVHWWPAGTPNPGTAIWAPEIHYLKGTYWIPYCTKLKPDPKTGALSLACGLLRSTTGRPEGPYKEVQPDTPLGGDDDASLFQDTDGKVYYLFGGYKIARLKDDMSGLAEAAREIAFAQPPTWGEGIFLTKAHGKYIFINTGNASVDPQGKGQDGAQVTYDCFSAVSSGSIYGPYTTRNRAIPHDGHNNLFQDKQGHWWATYFGSDPTAPYSADGAGRPCVLPVDISPEGLLRAARTTPRPVWRYRMTKPSGDWTGTAYPDAEWQSGGGAFGDPAIAAHGQVTDVGTPWTNGELWLRKTFTVKGSLPQKSTLYLRHSGPVQVFLNGREVAHESGATDDYVRLPIKDSAALRRGSNTLAVHCVSRAEGISQADAPAYVDVGVVETPPVPVPVARAKASEER